MKIFRTASSKIVEECQRFMNFLPITHQIHLKTVNFMQKFADSENSICGLFKDNARRQTSDISNVYKLSPESTPERVKCEIRESFLKTVL